MKMRRAQPHKELTYMVVFWSGDPKSANEVIFCATEREALAAAESFGESLGDDCAYAYVGKLLHVGE